KVITIDKSHYPVLSTFYLSRFLKVKLEEIVENLILYIEKEKIEKIWVTLSSPEIIIVTWKLSQKLKVKIYSTIWDVPEYLL
ncbi:hypothetical protein, partial [Photobacterium sp. R1]